MVVDICIKLGNGSNHSADKLLLETAQQETHLGRFRDVNPRGGGIGLTQFDLVGFEDVQERTRDETKRLVWDAYALDIDEVEHEALAFSPFLAFVFTRLKYRLRPEPIPLTVHERADYWKRFYNSFEGDGTPAQYIENAARLQAETRYRDLLLAS